MTLQHAPQRAIRPRKRYLPVGQIGALLAAFVAVSMVGGLLAAGLLLPYATVLTTASDQATTLFEEVPDEIRPGPLSQVSVVYAADGQPLATFYAQNRIVVPLDQVSEAMQHAVVAIEDERFYEHNGIDIRGVARAFVNNLLGNPQQGASTLTQQYVKNVLIDEAERRDDPFGVIEAREDSFARKLREMKYAIALEKELTKNEILEGYLNVAQFGVNSVYGVETAARYFFDKSAAELTPVEAATIAGVTKAPAKFDPTINPELAQARRDAVLYKMYSLGYLPLAEYRAAKAIPIEDTLRITPVPTGCATAEGAAFFCSYVISVIKNSPEFGQTEAERLNLLYRGGLSIHTTLDPDLQAAAIEQLAANIPYPNTASLEAAIVSVEPGTGRILAMAQNVPFDARSNPAPDTTAINYTADPAHGASKGFQIGSSFKVYVLAEWLLSGRTLNDLVDANRRERPLTDFTGYCFASLAAGQTWNPANVGDDPGGQVSVFRATSSSINTAYADMARQLDLCNIRDTAWSMGFRPTQGWREGTSVTLYQPEREDILVAPAMILGTQPTSPLYLAASFGTLASNGTYCEPIAITRVTDSSGLELPVPSANCNPNALPPNVAATAVHALQRVITEGTASRGGLAGGRVAAGKTGTNQNASQTWFTGFTPQVVTTAWVGEADGETPHLDIMFEGRRIRPLYSSTLAVPLWKSYMDVALAGYEKLPFPAPDPALVGKVQTPTPVVDPDAPTEEEPTAEVPLEPNDPTETSDPPAEAPSAEPED
ncbi:MAG: transglycosylase domain-containing protein [Promicromonosporaceae bacterium]|nr:transglycosylase domain-containing protein [Promicromonosporaceae bacterium]